MMIITLDKQNFMEQMRQHSRWKQFSYEAWEAIFDWEDEKPKVEFDPVAFCCDYAEYNSFEDLQNDYDGIIDKETLEDRTWVSYLPEGRILIRQF